MNEAAKNDKKNDKKENVDEVRKPGKSVQARRLDFSRGVVVLDNIRKEMNERERNLEKIRPDKYDYLTGEFMKKILAEECEKAGIPADTFEAKAAENLMEKSPIPLKPSPLPTPKTSSAFVGWRSSRRDYNLEFVGPFHVSAKYTIEPPLSPGEFRPTEQRFIFLG